MRERGWGVMWGCGGDSAVRPHSIGGVRGGRGGTHTHTHTQEHTQERTRECWTYPLATYPLKSARFRLPGAGGDHFHCTVEPSSGHTRCRLKNEGKHSLRGAPSAVETFMTRSGCSMEGAPPKKETVRTVLGVAQFRNSSGDGIYLIFQGLGNSDRTKPGNSEFALRTLFPGCFLLTYGGGSVPLTGLF